MTIFKRVADDNDYPTEPGTYRRIVEYWPTKYWSEQNKYWAELCCPGCGRVALLGSNHVVADDGSVLPSDVCPHSPCTFHEMISLEGWSRPSTTRRVT